MAGFFFSPLVGRKKSESKSRDADALPVFVTIARVPPDAREGTHARHGYVGVHHHPRLPRPPLASLAHAHQGAVPRRALTPLSLSPPCPAVVLSPLTRSARLSPPLSTASDNTWMDQHEAAVALAGDVAAMIQVRREGRGGEGERVDEMDARRAALLLGLFFFAFPRRRPRATRCVAARGWPTQRLARVPACTGAWQKNTPSRHCPATTLGVFSRLAPFTRLFFFQPRPLPSPQERNAASGPDASRLTAAARRKLGTLGSSLDSLRDAAETAAM